MFCPHICISCGKAGGILCGCCKNYIISDSPRACLACGAWLKNDVCPRCALPFSEQYCLGRRVGVLRRLIEVYKYHAVRAASFELAEMLGTLIQTEYTLVPLPTIRKHIRERGFDHIGLICKQMPFPVAKVLVRAKQTVQVGADRATRQRQAATAYVAKDLNPEARYLLVDDVWTTGSSMMAACEAMRARGAKNLAIAVIARSGDDWGLDASFAADGVNDEVDNSVSKNRNN
jgi:predicted amidophosphoribosyltransferase